MVSTAESGFVGRPRRSATYAAVGAAGSEEYASTPEIPSARAISSIFSRSVVLS